MFWKKSPPPPLPENHIHGVDLDVWNYLGFSELNFVEGPLSKPTKILRSANVFFFMHKEDETKRQYIIKPLGGFVDDRFHWNFERDHSYGTTHLPLWKAGEYEYYQLIHEPSKYTKERMLREFNAVRDHQNQKWVHASGAKIPPLLNKAVDKKKNKVESQEDNVVKVNFNKDDEKK